MSASSRSHAGAALAPTIVVTAMLPARAESLRTITDVWGGSGSGTFGSTIHAPFFGDVDIPMTWGSPWDLTVCLLALSAHTSDAGFHSTASLIDVQLFDASHRRITDATLSAASGTDHPSHKVRRRYPSRRPGPCCWA